MRIEWTIIFHIPVLRLTWPSVESGVEQCFLGDLLGVLVKLCNCCSTLLCDCWTTLLCDCWMTLLCDCWTTLLCDCWTTLLCDCWTTLLCDCCGTVLCWRLLWKVCGVEMSEWSGNVVKWWKSVLCVCCFVGVLSVGMPVSCVVSDVCSDMYVLCVAHGAGCVKFVYGVHGSGCVVRGASWSKFSYDFSFCRD